MLAGFGLEELVSSEGPSAGSPRRCRSGTWSGGSRRNCRRPAALRHPRAHRPAAWRAVSVRFPWPIAVYLSIGNCSRASGRSSSTGQGAWSRINRATCPTDFGPIVGLPPYSARGQRIAKSARHSVATFTISRSGHGNDCLVPPKRARHDANQRQHPDCSGKQRFPKFWYRKILEHSGRC
jgi:hypothetical protein